MPNDLFKRLPISLAVLQALAMWSNAYALPTGEALQAGQATFQHNGNTLRIDQSTAKAIVNWQSFNIGQNEAVNLFQPNHGAALFRILGPEASQIFGSLSATGSLFLSNPNGILFAPGSRVDVGSLVATTMRINNADFMSGNYQFYADPNHPDSSVINQGVIRTTDGGYLFLLGNKVENSGTLQANNGSVVLGSAESAVLDFYGDGLVKVNLSGDALNAAIEQTGNITANGGAVQLAANARTAALNVDGVIQANSLVERNGVIRLEGGANSTVLVSGKLEASGKDSGTKGGNITVTGERIALLDGATADASGSTGGGTILIGGDYQGKNAGIQNAERTHIATGASINADALDSGDGGKVVVWADDITRYYGNISAQGGVNIGNGGFAEVSGKNHLDFNGLVNTFASHGKAGTLLLDPTNITISTGVNSIESSGATIFQEASSATSILNTTTLQNALALNNVEVTTASPAASLGTITVSNAVGWSSGNSLTLTANSTIAINAAITTGTSASALILNATGNVTQSGTGIIGGQGGLTKIGAGTATLSLANTYTGATNINAGTLTLGAANRIADASAVTVASGATFNLGNFSETIGSLAGAGTVTRTGTTAVTLTTGGDNTSTTFSGVIQNPTGSIALTKNGTGTLTLAGNNTYTGTTTINAGTLAAGVDNAISTGAVTVNNGGTYDLNGFSDTIGALTVNSGSIGGAVTTGTGTLTLGGNVSSTGGASNALISGNLDLGAANRTFTTTNAADGLTVSAVISGPRALTKAGNGTLTLSGANTYTGATTINAGTLAISADNNLGTAPGAPTAGRLAFGGGTLEALSTFTLNANRGIALNTGGGTIQTDPGTTLTYNGIVAGANSLTKTGTGILTVGGNNTYTGATNINQGALVANSANALGTVAGGTTVANGATLNINNVAISTEAVNLNGTLTGTGTASLAGNITLGSASTIGTTSAVSSLGLTGIVNAPFALGITGAGNVTASNVNNNFTTVSINGANNVTLRDVDAIAFGTSTVNGTLGVTSNGAITQTGALNVAGATTLASGAANDITLTNIANDFSSVLVTNGKNVTVVDADDLTVGTSSVNTINARTLTGNLTLGGNIAATGAGNAIVLASAANFINSGDHTLSPGSGRWLVYSADPTTDSRGSALTTASAFKQYNTTYPGTIQGFGNGFIYSVAPTIAATLNGSASKVYDGTTAASIAGLSLGNSGAIDNDIVNLTGLLSANFDTKHVGTNKTITANGISISSATTSDGKQVYGYQLDNTSISNNSGSVTQATLNLNAVTDTKVYDGTTASTAVVATPGLASGDSIADLTQSFGSKNVLGVNGSTLAIDAGYTVNDGNGGGNYAITENTATGTIVQRAITVSTTDVTKTYDGTTSAAGTATVTVGNLVGGDSLNGGSFAFTDKNFGINNKTVTVGGVTVFDGNSGGNYDVNFADNTSSTINKKDITAVTGITASDKTYDGNTTATLNTSGAGFTGIISGESLTVGAATGTFNSKDVLAANTVNITGITLADDADLASNYNLTNTTATDAAVITAKDITAVTGITAADKVYDGNATATLDSSAAGFTGIVAGENLMVGTATGTFNSKDVVTANTVAITGITLADGVALTDLASNYNLTINTASDAAVITAKDITAVTGITAMDKVYDGNTTAILNTAGAGFAGIISGESLTVGAATGTFNSKDVVTANTVNITGITLADGADLASNYNLTNSTASDAAVINTKDITAVTGITAADKVYDGNTTATLDISGAGFTGIVSGEILAVGAATGTFNSKDVVTANTVNITGITLADGADLASNYNLTNNTASTSASVTAKDITAITGITANNKVYDGNTNATLNTGSAGFNGIVGGEILSVGSATGVFNSKDVVSANTVNISGLALADGAALTDLASNYNLTNNTASTSANITPKDITAVTDITAADKVYDGNMTATLDTSAVGFTGIVAGENLTVATATGTFNDKDVLDATTVNITGISLGNGAVSTDLASNYNLTSTTASDAAVITAKDITAVTGITAADKVYDGNMTATLDTSAAGFTGIVAGENLTVGAATGAFNSKDVVNANTVTISGITLADGIALTDLASNYNLTNTTASDTAVIAAKDITAVTGITAADKVYDGNTTATLDTSGAGFTGIVAGESLTVGTATGTFNSKDVVTANTVAISGITLANGTTGLASNYNLVTDTATDAAIITPRAITITADSGQTKVYGSVDPIFTFTVGGLGIATGDALSGNLNRATGETVGAYAMNQGSLAVPDASNYIVTYIGNDFNILQPASTTGLPSTTAGLVDLNPKLGAYTGSQLFILSLAPSAAGGDGTSADANLPQCESNPDKLAKDKDFSIMINYGLNLPEGLNNTCI